MEIITDKKSLQKRVKKELKNLKLSLHKLEEKTGISKTHIHRIMKDSDKVSLANYLKIAETLNIQYCITNVKDILEVYTEKFPECIIKTQNKKGGK